MGGFLEQYGAGDERRGKIVKRVVISLVALLVVAGRLSRKPAIWGTVTPRDCSTFAIRR